MFEYCVSVIIPVYNRETTIGRCLESVFNQNCLNYQVIIIDDGSTDSSYDLCKCYADKFSNALLVKTENKGVSAARNLGIRLSRGKWIAFIDSDDVVSPLYLSNLLKYSEITSEAPLVFNLGDKGLLQQEVRFYKEDAVFLGLIDNDIYYRSAPWNKLYSAALIKKYDIKFPEGVSIQEDFIFLVRYIAYIDSLLVYSNNDYSYIYEGNDHLSGRHYSFEIECRRHKLLKRSLLNLVSNRMIPDTKYWFRVIGLSAIRLLLVASHKSECSKVKGQYSIFSEIVRDNIDYLNALVDDKTVRKYYRFIAFMGVHRLCLVRYLLYQVVRYLYKS